MDVQKAALAIGKSGCYFLSIMYLAEKKTGIRQHPLGVFEVALAAKWCDEECFMKRPDLLLDHLLGSRMSCVGVRHETLGYSPDANELEITRYEKGGLAHFVVTEQGKIVYDPWGKGSAADGGRPVSKRIFMVVAA